jgi:hypothetical protein
MYRYGHVSDNKINNCAAFYLTIFDPFYEDSLSLSQSL